MRSKLTGIIKRINIWWDPCPIPKLAKQAVCPTMSRANQSCPKKLEKNEKKVSDHSAGQQVLNNAKNSPQIWNQEGCMPTNCNPSCHHPVKSSLLRPNRIHTAIGKRRGFKSNRKVNNNGQEEEKQWQSGNKTGWGKQVDCFKRWWRVYITEFPHPECRCTSIKHNNIPEYWFRFTFGCPSLVLQQWDQWLLLSDLLYWWAHWKISVWFRFGWSHALVWDFLHKSILSSFAFFFIFKMIGVELSWLGSYSEKLNLVKSCWIK